MTHSIAHKIAVLAGLLFLFLSTASAQTVNSSYELYLGDPETKLYYPSKCDEARKMIRRWEFSSAQDAESKGFKAGECTITRNEYKAENLFDSVLRKREGEPTDPPISLDIPEIYTPYAGDCGGKVVGVTDGDTVTILNRNNQQVKVRLAGIDAPERGQAFGQAAKTHLSALVFGKQVQCTSDKVDRYGRTVGKLIVNGVDVNLLMVKGCYAWHYKQFQGEQSASDRAAYSSAETSARNQGCGLWRDGNPISPWEFRRADVTILTEPMPSSSGGSAPSSGPKTVNVRGYTRKDGTYVQPHTRSAPRRKN